MNTEIRSDHEKTHLYQLTASALMAAALCVLAPLSVPVGVVPISLATLVIYLDVYILGGRMASLSCVIYLLIGLIGIPVFSGYSAGPAKLFGPTGGYLFGYLFLAFLSGIFIEKFPKNLPLQIIGMVAGTAVLYAFGTCWLALEMGLDAKAALMAGVIPFLPGDAVKIGITALIGPVIRRRLLPAVRDLTH